MEFRIAEIVLWPKKPVSGIRRVRFELDKINVITGQSQTGKSALGAIVDYCLGSGKCTIPVGIIREKTAWFGVVVQVEGGQLLLARREPGAQDQTGDMYLDEGDTVTIPKVPLTNINVDAVKARLDHMSRLPNVAVEEGKEGTYRGRPSFRDMAAFNFLPQHIVANPYTLFYKADTHQHQEKLKSIFPLVLGAVTSRTLMLQSELADVRRELQRQRTDLDRRRAAVQGWLSELRTSYSVARELGLLADSPPAREEWPTATYVSHLRAVASRMEADNLPKIPLGGSAEAVKQLGALRERELETSRLLADQRYKLQQLEALGRSANDYHLAIQSQNDRIGGVGWFARMIDERKASCPFCESERPLVAAQARGMVEAAGSLERASIAADNASIVIDRELTDTKRSLRALEEQLNHLREHRRLLESKTAEARQQRHTLGQVYRFVGRLEQSLANYDLAEPEGELTKVVMALEARAKALEAQLRIQSVRRLTDRALLSISRSARRYAAIVGVEKPDASVHLDIKNLTVRVAAAAGRFDYLWEIGSGANWMGYHLAIFLALHEHFLTQPFSPVPRFLMIDQPSQVYFPERWPEDPDPDTGNIPLGVVLKDRDLEGVNKIFQTLAAGISSMNGQLQIIVTDHAGEMTWSGVDNVNLVANWRGEALIPDEW